MRVAHFDCFSGLSGDMVLAALIDAGVDVEAIRAGLASFGLPIGLEVLRERRGGFTATYVKVDAKEEATHRFLPDVEAILNRGKLTSRQRDLALKIFRRLAEAEAAVHGYPIERVHFHEVGALDSIADIAGAAIGLDLLGVERFTSRPVPTGSGTVKCAHGLMPVPTPATAELLKGAPLAPSLIQAELTTPTGAAILATILRECASPAPNPWTATPVMTVERIGSGAGTRDFPDQPNILRLFVGELAQPLAGLAHDTIYVLETNLDDLPAETIGYCFDLLLAAGAVDVFTTSIAMKKNRPGVLLSVLAPEGAIPAVEEILFRETTTFGVRRYAVQRHKLQRQAIAVPTPWGPVQGKLGWRDGRPPIFAPEYEDCARVARQHGVALREVYAQAQRAYLETRAAPASVGQDSDS